MREVPQKKKVNASTAACMRAIVVVWCLRCLMSFFLEGGGWAGRYGEAANRIVCCVFGVFWGCFGGVLLGRQVIFSLCVQVVVAGGCTQFVHGRSRVTIDPRIPTMLGRSTSGFHQPGRHCMHQSAKRREVFGESHQR